MPNMVKRWLWKRYVYPAFALVVLILSWETNRTNAAVVEPLIPEQSIRLRILANSDDLQDQAVKRRVRDAIVQKMNGWVAAPASIEEARAIVRSKLPELDELVGRVLTENGFAYGYAVELGVVPFPAKMYGSKVYPAGDYEALRVTLGKGEGQNWWCVLFPPLCFVDIVAGETAAKDAENEADANKVEEKSAGKSGKEKEASASTGGGKPKAGGTLSDPNDKPRQAELKIESKSQIRFFFWEKLKALFA